MTRRQCCSAKMALRLEGCVRQIMQVPWLSKVLQILAVRNKRLIIKMLGRAEVVEVVRVR